MPDVNSEWDAKIDEFYQTIATLEAERDSLLTEKAAWDKALSNLNDDWMKVIERAQERERSLTAEKDELQALFDMQYKRSIEAVHRWREIGKVAPLTIPDFVAEMNLLFDEVVELRQKLERYERLGEALRQKAGAIRDLANRGQLISLQLGFPQGVFDALEKACREWDEVSAGEVIAGSGEGSRSHGD